MLKLTNQVCTVYTVYIHVCAIQFANNGNYQLCGAWHLKQHCLLSALCEKYNFNFFSTFKCPVAIKRMNNKLSYISFACFIWFFCKIKCQKIKFYSQTHKNNSYMHMSPINVRICSKNVLLHSILYWEFLEIVVE